MLIILDRDGVINYESEQYIKQPDEWIPIPGSLEAIARLTQAHHTLVVATNQAGVGRGYFSEPMLQKIHDKLLTLVLEHGGKITKIYYCPHHPQEECLCRKPRPGLLLNIAKDLQVDLKQAIFVGDSWRDIAAARQVGCKPILVKTGYGQKTLQEKPELADEVEVYADLMDFANAFITKGMAT